MNALPQPRPKRVVIYTRVSSEDQKERETIRTQQMELRRQLMTNPDLDFLGEYSDDGVSGTIRFQDRPGGRRLMDDAGRGIFEEVWVYRVDRLGRDDIDPLVVWRELERLGVRVVSLTEGVDGPFIYHIRVAVAAEERRTMLARMQAGTDRAAREGRFTGGIRPFGYQVVGFKENARYVPSEQAGEAELSEADVVRLIYERVGEDDWTCWQVARELEARGIPTLYKRDGRGVRGKRTSGAWQAGHVRNMIANPMYKGERHYGRRSPRVGREIIVASVPPLVSPELWHKAKAVLAAHRCRPRASARFYLLRGFMKCGSCGRTYVGTHHQGKTYYRCSGYLSRSKGSENCRNVSVPAERGEQRVFKEIERLLRDPSFLPLPPVPELRPDRAEREAEMARARGVVVQKEEERRRLLAAYVKEAISLEEFQVAASELDQARTELEERLKALEPKEGPEPPEPMDEALLGALRARLGGSLSESERREILQHVVGRITVSAEQTPEGKKRPKLVIEHRLPGALLCLWL